MVMVVVDTFWLSMMLWVIFIGECSWRIDQQTQYGGTARYFSRVARPTGLDITYLDMIEAGEEGIRAAIRPDTRVGGNWRVTCLVCTNFLHFTARLAGNSDQSNSVGPPSPIDILYRQEPSWGTSSFDSSRHYFLVIFQLHPTCWRQPRVHAAGRHCLFIPVQVFVRSFRYHSGLRHCFTSNSSFSTRVNKSFAIPSKFNGCMSFPLWLSSHDSKSQDP